MEKGTVAVTQGVNELAVGREVEVDRLRREHRELKARLSELNSRLYLCPEEEVERKKIQKLKLAKKDRLAMLASSS